MSNYPLWKYHPSCPDGVLVKSAEQLEAIGEGWVDSPTLFPPPPPPPEPEPIKVEVVKHSEVVKEPAEEPKPVKKTKAAKA